MSQATPPRPLVYVIEDDPAQRESLLVLLQSEGFETQGFGSAEAFLGAIAATPSTGGAAITDLRLPGLDGLGLLRALALLGASMAVVVLTGHGTVRATVEAMRLGAIDVLEKPVDPSLLLATVRRALAVTSLSGPRIAERAEAEARIAALSLREREVLALLVEGLANKAVAHRLGLSVRTVESYRGALMEKLGVTSFAAAVRLAVLAGPALASGRETASTGG
jgi:two-component system response regulator FixJ